MDDVRLGSQAFFMPKVDLSYLDALMPRLNVDALIRKIDAAAFMPKVDFTALMPKIDAAAFMPKVDFTAFLPKIDAAAFMPKVDFTALMPKIDAAAFMPKVDFTAFLPKVDPEVLESLLSRLDTLDSLGADELSSTAPPSVGPWQRMSLMERLVVVWAMWIAVRLLTYAAQVALDPALEFNPSAALAEAAGSLWDNLIASVVFVMVLEHRRQN